VLADGRYSAAFVIAVVVDKYLDHPSGRALGTSDGTLGSGGHSLHPAYVRLGEVQRAQRLIAREKVPSLQLVQC
jgi:hypothetical protein